MKLFLFLILRLLPLYVIIALGFLAGKYLNAKKETVASLLIYVIAPVVVFYGVLVTPLTLGNLSLPLLMFILACLICAIFYFVGSMFWQDSTRNILAFTSGTGNTGYFGLPVALAVLGQDVLGIVVLCTLGVILFENTVGFFITARGQHTFKQALVKVAKLPAIYAFIFGLLGHIVHLSIGSSWVSVFDNFKGTYSVLGMMTIGLGLSGLSNLKLDFKFTGLAFLAKFIVWPVFILGAIFLDLHITHSYNYTIYGVLVLLAIVPLAANTVAYATELNAQPEKAATAVFFSTLFALFYIPLIASLFLK